MKHADRFRFVLLAAMIVTASACARTDPPPESPPAGPGASLTADSATIARLEREARAIARADGCADVGQCLTAAVGERACGGPRDYIVYCARTTDTAALHRKLAELRQAEIDLNQRTGAVSTCEFREPPATQLVTNTCRAR
jgi:hypothetical protein